MPYEDDDDDDGNGGGGGVAHSCRDHWTALRIRFPKNFSFIVTALVSPSFSFFSYFSLSLCVICLYVHITPILCVVRLHTQFIYHIYIRIQLKLWFSYVCMCIFLSLSINSFLFLTASFFLFPTVEFDLCPSRTAFSSAYWLSETYTANDCWWNSNSGLSAEKQPRVALRITNRIGLSLR